MGNNMSKNKKMYDEKFKRDAINRLESSGEGIVKIAKDLSISSATLYNWKQKYGALDRLKNIDNVTDSATKHIIKSLNEQLKEKDRQIKILKQAFSILIPRESWEYEDEDE